MKEACKFCDGTGRLGFQQEYCCGCFGTGFVELKKKMKIMK